jgi:hypothetical protein
VQNSRDDHQPYHLMTELVTVGHTAVDSSLRINDFPESGGETMNPTGCHQSHPEE